ncbi:MAG: RNA 2',3'-cyclic phosphodiesterase [Omnitrophica bacterium]|nr:RNA 2',3'-cyclic phosphodiesterase [Candidatus Omnitrophota bacterium]
MPRTFIALELTEEIHQQLAQIQDELKKSGADVKWVKPSGIHLTLKFLGNVSLELIKEIKQVLNQLAKEHQGFELTISQLGAFPKVEYPRVIWVDIEQGKEKATQLAQGLEKGLINLGFLPEKRPLKPHLTLGRVRSSHNRNQLKTLLQSTTLPQATMQANTLTLFKSTLTPQGAIYEPLHKAKLD